MKVELIQGTKNPVELISKTARLCYGLDQHKNPPKLVAYLDKVKHHSMFEHVYYTFYIENISRTCLAQLTRHRLASYTVRSQRYCDESGRDFIIPETFDKFGDLTEEYFKQNKAMYQTLLDAGVPREDARFILPQASSTDLYMSFNLRTLLHLQELRDHNSSQWEIQELTRGMVSAIIEHSPELDFLLNKEEE